MSRRVITHGLTAFLFASLAGRDAHAQGAAALADEIIVISAGERAKQGQRDATRLGPLHGTTERPLGRPPGADEARLGERLPELRPLDTLQAAARPTLSQAPSDRRQGILSPALPRPPQAQAPLYGPIELPAAEDEGPPDGLTLEQAIAQLVRANPDLTVKYQEIPKAQADILTAGLWSNPLIFGSAGGVPYGSYSTHRPGSTDYSVSLVQPFDINGKIRARTRLAEAGQAVLAAQYQDAVRLEVENLHAAYVDVLAARATVGYLRAGSAAFDGLVKSTEDRVRRGEAPESELDTALIQRETATNTVEDAVTRLRQAKRRLAVLLGVPTAQADAIEPRASLHDRAPAPPRVEELDRLALCNRPDLAAYRLGVRSALANAELQRRERFPDVFALYTPYGFQANNDNPAARGATSWGAGIFATIPIANRNQGNIRRADHNVLQSQMEVSGLEDQVAAEVENAAMEYDTTRRAVERIERLILPRAAHRREDRRRLYAQGQENLDTYLNAQRDYNEVIQQYRDAQVRHRRAMLGLNTAIGVRLLP
jgi:cobalt-zinc-cadmium efflux system outer membrane protein